MSENQYPAPNFSTPERSQSPEQLVAMVRQEVPMAGIPQFYDRAYTEILAALKRINMTPAGPALGISYGFKDDLIDLGAAFPVEHTFTQDGDVNAVTIPSCEIATLTVHGSNDLISQGYALLREHIVGLGEEPGNLAWEEYLTMPAPGGDPDLNVTQLRWMIAPTI